MMQRQAIGLSPYQLRKLADKLEKEGKESCKLVGLPYYGLKKKIQVNLINKTFDSDTWEIEYK